MVIQNYLIFWHKADDGESLRAIESGDVCFIFSKWHGATAIIVPLSQFPSFDVHCSIDTSGAVDMICPGRLDSRELRRICHLGILKRSEERRVGKECTAHLLPRLRQP